MAGAKYLTQSGGGLAEVASNQASAGAGDAGKIVALDGSGRIDNSMMPVGIGADTQVVTASEGLADGDYVNIWDSAGTFKVRKADASAAGKEAHGFVLASVLSGAAATVYFEGTNGHVTGQSPGTVYLSASTPGAGTNTPPSGTGKVVQRIGFATAATAVNFDAALPITLA
jgi:hypothetical protein